MGERLDLTVHDDNGQKHDVAVRSWIEKGEETRVIDLPGEERAINKVSFVDQTGQRRGAKATIHLFGKR